MNNVSRSKGEESMNKNVTKEFSEKLRNLISESGKSIKQLSLELGIPSGSLSKYQNDAAEPGINNLYKIAEYFSVSTDYLLGFSNVKSIDIEIKAISEKLGLSGDSIEILEHFKANNEKVINVVNFIIEAEKPWVDFNLFINTPFNGVYIDSDFFTDEGIEHSNRYDEIQSRITSMFEKNINILEIISDYFSVQMAEEPLFVTNSEIKKESDFANDEERFNNTITISKPNDFIDYAFLSEIQTGLKNLKKNYTKKATMGEKINNSKKEV